VKQSFSDESVAGLLRDCLTITYNAINYGEKNDISNRKGFKGFYGTLKEVERPSCYKTATITRACAVLKSRKKSEKRGIKTTHPKHLRPMICVTSGFFITMKGRLFVPLERNKYFDIQLNDYVFKKLEGKKIRSLTITQDSLSFCYSEDVEERPIQRVFGVDRNEKNISFGDAQEVTQIDVSKLVKIKQTNREIVGSFKRNDIRIRRKLARKYGARGRNRTNQILHAATNFMVKTAAENDATFAIEALTGIRKLYQKGNGQGKDYRFRLNSWPHWKVKEMLEYKSLAQGIEIIKLTKSETYGSSSECSTCGEKLCNPAKDDVEHKRMLWCQTCKIWIDRDVNAVLNLSKRGLARFVSSLPRPESRLQQTDFEAEEKGLAGEAVTGNGTTTLILRVDASKLVGGHHPTLYGVGHHPLT